MKYLKFAFLSLFIFSCSSDRSKPVHKDDLLNDKVRRGLYLGETVDSIPKIFGEDFVSRNTQELNAAFSPDGKELFFTLSDIRRTHYVLCHALMKEDSTWTKPQVASFAGKYSDADPMFSPDGQTLYFISRRPYSGTEEQDNFDIWKVSKTGSGWGEPEALPESINDEFNQYYVSITNTGNIYYASRKSKDESFDIFKASKTADGYLAERLGAPINTENSEGDVYVAPDESYMIFVGRREDSYGSGDLYISYNETGEWTEPQNLGPEINSPYFDYCPIVSFDGKYFFYTSYRAEKLEPSNTQKSIEEVEEIIGGITNGMGNIYWVKADFIDALRTEK